MKKHILLTGALFLAAFSQAQTWQWDGKLEAEDYLNIRDISVSDGSTGSKKLHVVGQFKDWLPIGSRWIASNNRSKDGFIAQYDLNGNLEWILPFGNDSDDDVATVVTTDRAGNLYVGGTMGSEYGSSSWDYTLGSTLYTTTATTSTTPITVSHTTGSTYPKRPFVAKIDVNGNVKWLDVPDAVGGEITAITLDPYYDGAGSAFGTTNNGKLYVAGTYLPTYFNPGITFNHWIGTPQSSPTVSTYGNNSMAYIAKYQTNYSSSPQYGFVEWVRFLSNSYQPYSQEIVVKGLDAEYFYDAGNYYFDIYATGFYKGELISNLSTIYSASNTYAGFAAKLNESNGNLSFVKKIEGFNGSTYSNTFGIATAINAQSGDWYIIGNYHADRALYYDGVSGSPALSTYFGNSDIFMLNLDRSGNLNYANHYGGSGDDYAGDVSCFDHPSGGASYPNISGTYYGSVNIGGISLSSIGSYSDHFISHIDASNGNGIWAIGIDGYHNSGDDRTLYSAPKLVQDRTYGTEVVYHSGYFKNGQTATMTNSYSTTYNYAGYLGKYEMCQCQAITNLVVSRINSNDVSVDFDEPSNVSCLNDYDIVVTDPNGQYAVNEPTTGAGSHHSIVVSGISWTDIFVVSNCSNGTVMSGNMGAKTIKPTEDKDAPKNPGTLLNHTNVKVYPNPAQNEVNVLFTPGVDNKRIEDIKVVDAAGKELNVQILPLNPESTQFNINVSELAPGTYFIHLKVGEHFQIEKLTIE